MSHPEQCFDTGELVLNYTEDSLSGPPLLLIHGLSGRMQSWEPLTPYLTPAWHVVRCDLRGHGKSGRAAGQYHLVDYTRDAIALTRGLFAEPAVLVGHSLGALIAAAAAAQAPERVRAIVLLDPPLFVHDSPTRTMASAHQLFLFLAAILKNRPSHEELVAACRTASPDADPAFIQEQADNITCLDVGTVEIALRDELLVGWDWEAGLRRVGCPVLLMRGEWELNAAVREEDAAYAQARLPHLMDIKLPGGTHGFPWEQPDATMGCVQAFLQSV